MCVWHPCFYSLTSNVIKMTCPLYSNATVSFEPVALAPLAPPELPLASWDCACAAAFPLCFCLVLSLVVSWVMSWFTEETDELYAPQCTWLTSLCESIVKGSWRLLWFAVTTLIHVLWYWALSAVVLPLVLYFGPVVFFAYVLWTTFLVVCFAVRVIRYAMSLVAEALAFVLTPPLVLIGALFVIIGTLFNFVGMLSTGLGELVICMGRWLYGRPRVTVTAPEPEPEPGPEPELVFQSMALELVAETDVLLAEHTSLCEENDMLKETVTEQQHLLRAQYDELLELGYEIEARMHVFGTTRDVLDQTMERNILLEKECSRLNGIVTEQEQLASELSLSLSRCNHALDARVAFSATGLPCGESTETQTPPPARQPRLRLWARSSVLALCVLLVAVFFVGCLLEDKGRETTRLHGDLDLCYQSLSVCRVDVDFYNNVTHILGSSHDDADGEIVALKAALQTEKTTVQAVTRILFWTLDDADKEIAALKVALQVEKDSCVRLAPAPVEEVEAKPLAPVEEVEPLPPAPVVEVEPLPPAPVEESEWVTSSVTGRRIKRRRPAAQRPPLVELDPAPTPVVEEKVPAPETIPLDASNESACSSRSQLPWFGLTNATWSMNVSPLLNLSWVNAWMHHTTAEVSVETHSTVPEQDPPFDEWKNEVPGWEWVLCALFALYHLLCWLRARLVGWCRSLLHTLRGVLCVWWRVLRCMAFLAALVFSSIAMMGVIFTVYVCGFRAGV